MKRTAPRVEPSSPRVPPFLGGLGRWLLATSWLLFVVARPITYDGLWWELSRGRAVLQGHLMPSQTLLVADTRPESDWLGGLPFYGLYQTFGPHGLMLLRWGTAGLVILLLLRIGRGKQENNAGQTFLPLLAAGFGLAAAAPALQPAPWLWDLLGMSGLFWAGRRDAENPSRRSLWLPALLTASWANLGPRFGLAPLVLLTAWLVTAPAHDAVAPLSTRQRTWGLVLLFLAGCANPRGIWGWWDSARLLLPPLVKGPAEASSTLLVQDVPGSLAALAAGVGWLLLLVLPMGTRRERLATLFTGFCTGLFSMGDPTIVPVTGTWCWIVLVTCWPSVRWPTGESSTAVGNSPAASQPRWRRGLLASLLTLLGWWWAIQAGWTTGLGWGLDARLDDRLLRLLTADLPADGVAWSDDVRAIGMWCWVTGGKFPVHDAPQRALLGGRADEFGRLGEDLRAGRSFRYVRHDGSLGGWWLDLQARQISLLLVAAEDVSLVSSLAPSIWQPLLLDSPVIPFARAGDPEYQKLLVRAVQQRDFLEYGPWQFTGVASTGSEYDRDRWGLTLPADGIDSGLRQARFLRALRLPVASARILNRLRRAGADGEVWNETWSLQRQLQHQELIAAGTTSPLRTAVIALAPLPNLVSERPAPPFEPPAPDPLFGAAARNYLDGELAPALDNIPRETLAGQLVAAQLQWEQGEPVAAIETLRALANATGRAAIGNLARTWLRELNPDAEPAGSGPEAGHGPESRPTSESPP